MGGSSLGAYSGADASGMIDLHRSGKRLLAAFLFVFCTRAVAQLG